MEMRQRDRTEPPIDSAAAVLRFRRRADRSQMVLLARRYQLARATTRVDILGKSLESARLES